MARRHHAQNNLGFRERLLETGNHVHVRRQAQARQKHVIFPGCAHAYREVRFMHAQPDTFEAWRQYDRQSGSPTAGAEDRQFHLRLPSKRASGRPAALHAKTFSVPERSRSMFDLWRYTMKAPAMSDARKTGSGGWRMSHTPSGNVAAARMDPAEMYLVTATVTMNTITAASSGTGVRYKNAPMKVAMAFPPLNFRNTGNACP